MMVDILVRNVDGKTAKLLKEKAAKAGMSVSETVRGMISAGVQPSKAEIWAEIDRIRVRNARVSGDSTRDIRDDRDSR